MVVDVNRMRGGNRRLAVVLAMLCVAAGAGGCQATHAVGPDGSRDGAAGAGGAGGAGGVAGKSGAAGGAGGANPLCTNSAPFDRSCVSDDDCVAAAQNNCPAAKVVGIRASELARFNTFQQTCPPPQTRGGCDNPPVPPEVDDGSPLYSDAQAKVACQAGTCTTYSSTCGHVCGAGTSCFSCATAGGSFAACTARCTSSACQDPGFPSCQGINFFEGPLTEVQEQFCAPAGVVCCQPCTSATDAGGPDARGDAAAD
jgi:hypothetical protein